MEIREIFDLFYNLNEHLGQAAEDYGMWVYIFLFLIIFSETGLIIFAFLPGDSLIFAAGSLVALDILDPVAVFILIPVAAFAGDQINYFLGKVIGNRIIRWGKLPYINQENLDKTEKFYKAHGAKTIIYGRYIPVIRSFAPFVAASGKNMQYGRFLKLSFIGSFSWALLFLIAGLLLGEVQFVKDHFYLVVLAILTISLIPAIIEFVRQRKKRTGRSAARQTSDGESMRN